MIIRNKLILGFTIIATFVILVGAIAAYEMKSIEGKFDIMVNELIPIVEVLEELKFHGLKLVTLAFEYDVVESEDWQDIDPDGTHHQEAMEWKAHIEKEILSTKKDYWTLLLESS